MSLQRLQTVVRVLPLALLGSGLLSPAWAQIARIPPSAARPLVQSERGATVDLTLRVLLAEAAALSLAAPSDQPLQIRDGSGTVLAQLAAGQELRLQADRLNSGLAGLPMLSAPPDEIWFEPAASEGVVVLQQRPYRGLVQVRRQGDGLQAINHVGLEAYLPSVVGSEMPASWPQPALRAQAVAARTYALRQRRPEAPFDLQATVASQVYRGVEGETDSTREAVTATRGLVLTYGGNLIEAVFHSSSGGSTEASGELWSQQLPYLVAVPDFDQHSPVSSWQERFEPIQLRGAFAETGGVLRLQVVARTTTGRVRQVRVEGPQGSLLLSGAQLRKRLGLRSTLFDIDVIPLGHSDAAPATAGVASQPLVVERPQDQQTGTGSDGTALAPPLPPPVPELVPPEAVVIIRGRGFGHGIGMSQWGAHGLARRGADYAAILSHYYPGTQLNAYRGP